MQRTCRQHNVDASFLRLHDAISSGAVTSWRSGVEADDEAGERDGDDGVEIADGRPERILVDVRHLFAYLLLLCLRQHHLRLGALAHDRVLRAFP